MKNYFHESELTCKCGCGEHNFHPETLRKLNLARELAGIPFVPSSACRCPTRNESEGGVDYSAHIATPQQPCRAMDVKTPDSRTRYKVLAALIEAGFTRIGIARSFIHADDAGDSLHDPEVTWLY